MIPRLGSYLPSMVNNPHTRMLATKIPQQMQKGPNTNPKIACVVIGVLGVASFWAKVRTEVPEEYKGPNNTVIDDDD